MLLCSKGRMPCRSLLRSAWPPISSAALVQPIVSRTPPGNPRSPKRRSTRRCLCSKSRRNMARPQLASHSLNIFSFNVVPHQDHIGNIMKHICLQVPTRFEISAVTLDVLISNHWHLDISGHSSSVSSTVWSPVVHPKKSNQTEPNVGQDGEKNPQETQPQCKDNVFYFHIFLDHFDVHSWLSFRMMTSSRSTRSLICKSYAVPWFDGPLKCCQKQRPTAPCSHIQAENTPGLELEHLLEAWWPPRQARRLWVKPLIPKWLISKHLGMAKKLGSLNPKQDQLAKRRIQTRKKTRSCRRRSNCSLLQFMSWLPMVITRYSITHQCHIWIYIIQKQCINAGTQYVKLLWTTVLLGWETRARKPVSWPLIWTSFESPTNKFWPQHFSTVIWFWMVCQQLSWLRQWLLRCKNTMDSSGDLQRGHPFCASTYFICESWNPNLPYPFMI